MPALKKRAWLHFPVRRVKPARSRTKQRSSKARFASELPARIRATTFFARLIGAEGSCGPHPRKCRSPFAPRAQNELAARARLAELEAGFTIEKAQVEAMKARLFARLRAHFQRRDRLRLVIGYRRKDLEALVRQGEAEAGKIAQEYRPAGAQQKQEGAETAAALAEKQELTAEEAAEVSQLWRKLVKLFYPDRCAHEPEKQETDHQLTAAIKHAKDHGDLTTLRRIAEDHRRSNGLHPAARLGGARLRGGARARATAPADHADPGVFRRDSEEASRGLGEGTGGAGM